MKSGSLAIQAGGRPGGGEEVTWPTGAGYLLGTPDTSRRGRSTRNALSAFTSNPAPFPPRALAPSALVACSKMALKSLQEKKERGNVRTSCLPGGAPTPLRDAGRRSAQAPPARIGPLCGRVRDPHRMTVPQGRSRLPRAGIEQPRQGVRQAEAAARARSSAPQRPGCCALAPHASSWRQAPGFDLSLGTDKWSHRNRGDAAGTRTGN